MRRSHEEILTSDRKKREKKRKMHYLCNVSFLINLAYSDIFPECLERCCSSWATVFVVISSRGQAGTDRSGCRPACLPKNYHMVSFQQKTKQG